MSALPRPTKKSCLARLSGQLVIKRVEGISTIEDIDAMRDTLINQLKAQGIPLEAMTETEEAFEFSNGQSVLKPKVHREETGTFEVRSKDYIFITGERMVYGDTRDGTTEYRENGFTRYYPKGQVIHFDLAH